MRAEEVDPVRQHDALGHTGAPAREEHDVGVALGELGIEVVGIIGVGGREVGEPHEHATRGCGHIQTCGCVRIVDDEQRRLCRAHDRRRLVGAPRVVDGRERGTELGQCDDQGHHLEVRAAPHHDAITARDAVRGDSAGHSVGAAIELAERERLLADHRGQPVGNRARRVAEHIADQEVRRHPHPPFLALREQ